MKNKIALLKFLFFTCIILLAPNFYIESQNIKQGTSDDAEIRKVMNEFNDAWTARNADRYAGVFTEDADWENAFGNHLKGKAQIKEMISGLMNQFTTADEKITDTRIWSMSPNFALVDIYQTIDGQKLPKSGRIVPTRHIRMTQVYEKQKGKWMIKVHRVTDLREMKQNNNASLKDSTLKN
jgi:uncharacterized protein (TIGR02246 family)